MAKLVRSVLCRMQEWANRVRRYFSQRLAPLPLAIRGERAAAKYLRRHGYTIVATRSRSALGELDIVAVQGRTVVFVEVKTRRSHRTGHPAEAVDGPKQRQLSRVALGYLKRHGLLSYPARFDVVAVTWPDGQKRPDVRHYPAAFEFVE